MSCALPRRRRLQIEQSYLLPRRHKLPDSTTQIGHPLGGLLAPQRKRRRLEYLKRRQFGRSLSSVPALASNAGRCVQLAHGSDQVPLSSGLDVIEPKVGWPADLADVVVLEPGKAKNCGLNNYCRLAAGEKERPAFNLAAGRQSYNHDLRAFLLAQLLEAERRVVLTPQLDTLAHHRHHFGSMLRFQLW